MRCDFCVDDSKGHHSYDRILGHAIVSGRNVELGLSNKIVRVNGGMPKYPVITVMAF